jgi:formate--tetrahydrofolate ligase
VIPLREALGAGLASHGDRYPDTASLRDKIAAVATRVYGADGVNYSSQAAAQLDTYERAGFGHLPVCIAKTHPDYGVLTTGGRARRRARSVTAEPVSMTRTP